MWARFLLWVGRATGIARLGRALLTVVLPVALVGATGAFWAGIQWQQGRAAEARAAEFDQAVEEHEQVAAQQRSAAEGFTKYRSEQLARRDVDDAAIEQYLRNHPELGVCVLDDRGLRLWNGDDAAGDP